jgi:hypothetical protein
MVKRERSLSEDDSPPGPPPRSIRKKPPKKRVKKEVRIFSVRPPNKRVILLRKLEAETATLEKACKAVTELCRDLNEMEEVS